MGNSSSAHKAPSHEFGSSLISKPARLGDNVNASNSPIGRRASAHSSTRHNRRNDPIAGNNDSLGVPTATGPHRRTQSASALAAAAAGRTSLPPPPYSAVADTPVVVSPQSDGPRNGMDAATASSRRSSNHPTSNDSRADGFMPGVGGLVPGAGRSSSVGSSHTRVVATPEMTPAARRGNNVYLRAPMRQNTAENALETLRKYDTVIIVDDSKSMHGALWHEVCPFFISGLLAVCPAYLACLCLG